MDACWIVKFEVLNCNQRPDEIGIGPEILVLNLIIHKKRMVVLTRGNFRLKSIQSDCRSVSQISYEEMRQVLTGCVV